MRPLATATGRRARRLSTKTSGWRSIFDTRWIDRESRQRFDTPGDRSFLMSLEGGLRSQLEEERKVRACNGHQPRCSAVLRGAATPRPSGVHAQ